MTLFETIRAKGISYFVTDEDIYAEVLREVETDVRRDGLWARALADSDMDNDKARAAYIRLRAGALKDEVSVFISELGKVELENFRQRNDALQVAEIEVAEMGRQLQASIAEAERSASESKIKAEEAVANLQRQSRAAIAKAETALRYSRASMESTESDLQTVRREFFAQNKSLTTYRWITWTLVSAVALVIFLISIGVLRIMWSK
jgi:hypothetical protein